MSQAGLTQPASPEYELGGEISFAGAGSGSRYTREGFARPEPWGVWTLGDKARLELFIGAGAPKALRITYRLFMGGRGKPAASVVRLNGLDLGSLTNKPQRWGEVFTAEFPLPGRRAGNKRLEVEFDVSGYRAGSEASAQDSRPIGLGLISLTVEGRHPAAARDSRGKRARSAADQ